MMEELFLTDIKKYLDDFKVFMENEKGIAWKHEREERNDAFYDLLNKENVLKVNENDFRDLIKSLWATGFWTNKDYKVDRLLEDNGMEIISDSLFNVLYDNKPLKERYDTFLRKINGIGPSMLTEILTFVDPESYCIWNDKPKKVLPFLDIKGSLPDRVFKYDMKGKEYEQCLDFLSNFRDYIGSVIDNPDFLDVDLFFAYLFYEIIPNESDVQVIKPENIELTEKVPKPKIRIVGNHSRAQKFLIDLGHLMGFDTYIPPEDRSKVVDRIKLEDYASLRELPICGNPDTMDTVKHIDVLWIKEEYPKFGFEVEESTDVTKGLLRLYQLRNLHIKPIIVGPESKKRKFDIEIRKDPFYKIKDQYKFISYSELAELLDITKNYSEMRKDLLGI